MSILIDNRIYKEYHLRVETSKKLVRNEIINIINYTINGVPVQIDNGVYKNQKGDTMEIHGRPEIVKTYQENFEKEKNIDNNVITRFDATGFYTCYIDGEAVKVDPYGNYVDENGDPKTVPSWNEYKEAFWKTHTLIENVIYATKIKIRDELLEQSDSPDTEYEEENNLCPQYPDN